MARVRSRFVDRALVLLVLLCVGLGGLSTPMLSSTAAAADPLRVLIIGDSVTQGSSGDWTWRYRLWKHLQATSTGPVEFVGPRDDLHDYLTDENGNHDYIDASFDQDHAARWGMTLALADNPIDQLVETYQPDVVVEMLGTNDLLFLTRTPAEVRQDIDNFVTAARSADPGIDVVLSEVTQTWFDGAPELNDLLADGAAQLDTSESRVLLADADDGYNRSEHTFDDSHPNAAGEVLIAAAVADRLADLGVGASPARPLPTVPLGPRIPSVLTGSVADRHVSLSWTLSPGATSQLAVRDATEGTDWTVVADKVKGTSWSLGPVPVGHAMQFRVLPRKGTLLAQPDVASNVVTIKVPRVPGKTRVSVKSRASGRAVISWRAARRASHYLVEMRRVGRGGWRVLDDHRTRTRIVKRGLRPGARYHVRVTPANSTGPGVRSKVRFVVPSRR